jgi:hypothetical protein
LVLLGGLLFVMAFACEPKSFVRGVTYVNRTGQEIAIYQDSRKQFHLDPGEVSDIATIVGYPQLSFEARDRNGRVIFRLKTTAKELERMGWRIVITDQTLTPTPTPPARPPQR